MSRLCLIWAENIRIKFLICSFKLKVHSDMFFEYSSIKWISLWVFHKSIRLSNYPFIKLSIHSSNYLSIHPVIQLSIHPSNHPPVHSSTHPSFFHLFKHSILPFSPSIHQYTSIARHLYYGILHPPSFHPPNHHLHVATLLVCLCFLVLLSPL